MRYNPEASKAIQTAVNKAVTEGYDLLVLEHLLYVLADSPSVREVLENLSVSVDALKKDLADYLDQNISKKSFGSPRQSSAFSQLTQSLVISIVGNSGRQEIEATDLLVGFYAFTDSYAKYYLEKNGAYKEDVYTEITQLRQEKIFNGDESSQEDSQNGQSKKQDEYLINLNEKAKHSKIDPVIGREYEIERVIQILSKRKKNNAILVGEPGVGKTAIAEGLAKKIVEGSVHESIKGSTVFSLDLGALTAGTKFRGEFEARLKKAIKKVSSTKNAILFIDEIHTLIGAGATGGGSMDAANLLKPALANGDISCIGATTYKEYRNHFEKDAALTRRFEKVDVVEPSIEDSTKILVGLKDYYEDHHGVKYSDEAIKASVELSAKYISNKFLPDKAIDIMDEAGVVVKLDSNLDDKTVKLEHVEKVIAKVARLPEKTVVGSETDKVKNLRGDLKNIIFGQEEAIDKVVNSIQLAKSGLRRPTKPIGSFLFCGPTGVGKTELAKQLAQNLGYNFVRFDMSEYMSKHEVAKFTGAPPGYVGYDQEGALTSAVIKNPSSVILLDELEKAHPDIWNILLQVMDHGTLTDNYGKKADFKQAIVIMTSNVGVQEFNQSSIGLILQDEKDKKPTKEIERTFPPEFRNRLDALVWFNKLNEKTIKEVLNKNLMQLDLMLLEKNVAISYTEELKDWLAKKGYDPLMGARPMARLIEEKVSLPLSGEILFGKLVNGGKVEVSLENDEVKFTFKEKATKKKGKKEVIVESKD